MSVSQKIEANIGEILTPEKVAELLPWHPGVPTVRSWLRQGKVPGAFQSPGGRWFIPASSLEGLVTFQGEEE